MKKDSNVEDVTPYESNSESKGRQVEEMFDAIAPAYDFMNTAMTFGLHKYWRDKALRSLNISSKSHILDVATGTGDVAFRIYDMFRPSEITGIDLSSGMLDVARRKLANADAQKNLSMKFMEGDCLNLPFSDNSFDTITVAYGVRNFERLAEGYAEMCRVLKPGGEICVIELSTPVNRLTGALYKIYSRCVIPTIGRLVSGDSRAYTYLPESIAAAPQRTDMTNLMQKAGFKNCRFRSLTFGVVTIYIANK
jgi:demethylmenaquinone methyltransferase/2-methoxy-6-polyprenyl-1,4-benzoquinol methylase